MTSTAQLDAHMAVVQVDAVRRELVMSFRPTAELLVAELDERDSGAAGLRRLRDLLTAYCEGVLSLDRTLADLRAQCGSDPDDLPDAADADVRAEVARLRAALTKNRRRHAGGGMPGTAACGAEQEGGRG